MSEDKDDIAFVRALHTKSHDARDKALITLCSSALGFSLVFYEKVYSGHYLWVLILTWLLFAVSMLATLYSFETAAFAADSLASYYKEKSDGLSYAVKKYTALTNRFNRISLVCFTLGVIMFMIFAISNTLYKGTNMTKTFAQDGSPILTSMNPTEFQNGQPVLKSIMPINLEKGAPIPLSMIPPTKGAQGASQPTTPISSPALPTTDPAKK